MILCDEPYLNEPGWAMEHGTPASKARKSTVLNHHEIDN